MRLIIVTGLSGSGKSIALSTLEDLGYYCIDNLPVCLLEHFVSEVGSRDDAAYDKVAVGIDARNDLAGLPELPAMLTRLRDGGTDVQVLYLQAEHNTLLKRFSETRRRHPLTSESVSLDEAIREEARLIEPIALDADLHVDTTHTNLHQLRDVLAELTQGSRRELALQLESFGFKHGRPMDADFVFDVRCLPNPHWDATLRPLTGRDKPVRQFLERHDEVHGMYRDVQQFLSRWIPHFEASNRSYLTVAIGCTGGQHRSVYVVERLAAHFRRQREVVLVRHREQS